MRIAVPIVGDQIAMRFAGCKEFKFYYVEEGKLVKAFPIASGVDTVEDTARFLHMAGAQMVVCGGIGGAVIKALDREGILIMGGIVGNADEKMKEFVDGTIRFSPIDPKRVHDHSGCAHHHGDDGLSHDHKCDAEDCANCAHSADGSCH